MVLFNFLNFFAIFLEFSIMHQIETERNDNFYFLSFLAISKLYWLEMKPQWYFFYFLNFFAISVEFSIMRQVGTERNDNFSFPPFSSSFNLWWLEMEPLCYFLIFFEFFCVFFLNFLLRVGQERSRTTIFIFFLSRPFPTNSGFK